MILIETSVLVSVLRDRSGGKAQQLLDLAGDREIVISRFSELELLVGAKDDADWQKLTEYLGERRLLQPESTTWRGAARIYYELRRQGQTIRSIVDCCIAQIALEHDVPLVHEDRDFEVISTARPLKQLRLSGLEPFVHG
ncbi:MAG: type II toxin-antitoxin system VapC family toxin [Hyphomicrobium sp.]